MPAVVEAPIEGAELGSTVDAVLRPTEGFSITGPVTWRMTDTDQALEATAAADPDGAYRLSGAEISELPSGEAHFKAAFMGSDRFRGHPSCRVEVAVTLGPGNGAGRQTGE